MANKFETFLSSVGKGFAKGLGWAVKEAPAASALAAVLFPPSVAVSPLITAALDLTQNTVMAIEQKYTASGVQSGTGVQKAAEVATLAGPAVATLLTAAGVNNANADYVTKIVTLVADLLNARAPAATVPVATA